jgi:hypothetical protein
LDTSAGTSSRFVTTTTTNAKIIPALMESAEEVRDSEAEEAAETRDDDYLQNDSSTADNVPSHARDVRHQWCCGSMRGSSAAPILVDHASIINPPPGAFHDSVRSVGRLLEY